jgi:hypothetical protein
MTIFFATLAIASDWEKEAVLLIESLRTFGGKYANNPAAIFSLRDNPLAKKTLKKLEVFEAENVEFEMDPASRNFPLAMVVHGAAAAERHLQSSSDILVWLLPDTIILNEPTTFLLPKDRKLGYRPVHHQNIGSSYNQPLDSFWQRVYQHCFVPQEHVFRMETCYRETVRPYFNAGILVTRPEDGLMSDWLEAFQGSFQHPDFVPFFEQRKYAIFMHQAILAGVVLKKYIPSQLESMPESYNYPLHMHANYPEPGRAKSLNQLVTVRYERLPLLKGFINKIQVDPPLQEWFKEKKLHQ